MSSDCVWKINNTLNFEINSDRRRYKKKIYKKVNVNEKKHKCTISKLSSDYFKCQGEFFMIFQFLRNNKTLIRRTEAHD